MMTTKRLIILFLVMFLARPAGVPASYAESDMDEGEPPRSRSKLFWGALAAVNSAILVSSISDMMLYESRADEAWANGEEFKHFREASSREKFIIGISAASLLVSLAGLKLSFQNRAPFHSPSIEPVRRIVSDTSRVDVGAFQVISLEGRVRYDTLFTAAAVPESVVVIEEYGVLPVPFPVDTIAKVIGNRLSTLPGKDSAGGMEPLTKDPVDTAFLNLLSGGEDSFSGSDLPPGVGEWGGSVGGGAAVISELPVDLDTELLPEKRAKEWVSVIESEDPDSPPTFRLLPYGVHVSSFRTIERTDAEEEIWAKRGEIVVIEEVEIDGDGTWYRVVLGNFEKYDEAREYAALLRTEWNLDYTQVRKR